MFDQNIRSARLGNAKNVIRLPEVDNGMRVQRFIKKKLVCPWEKLHRTLKVTKTTHRDLHLWWFWPNVEVWSFLTWKRVLFSAFYRNPFTLLCGYVKACFTLSTLSAQLFLTTQKSSRMPPVAYPYTWSRNPMECSNVHFFSETVLSSPPN